MLDYFGNLLRLLAMNLSRIPPFLLIWKGKL